MFKPTFTQPAANTSFGFAGTSTSTPFGQSSFGKMSNTSGFGSTAFGTPSTPMFGGQNQTQTGLFASAAPAQAFGQPTNTQPSFAFGSPNPTTNLFNQPQQPSSSGLFGSTPNTSFGQKPAFQTFGSPPSTGIFGSAQSTPPQQTATPLFGQTGATNTGLFGGTTSFANQANQQTGTIIKFNPVTGTDTMMKNRQTHQIQTRHHCITFMKEYESKSLEELRYEDYLVNRKGPQQGTSGGSGLFGQMSTTSIVGTGGGLFGATPSVSQGFGQTSSAFGAPQNTNLFGQKPAFGGPTVASTASPFSFNPQPAATVTPFGSNQAKPFGAVAPNTGLFSTPSTQPTNTFGATNTFGNFGTPTSANTGFGLNQNKPTTGTFTLNPTNSTGFNTFGQPQSTLFGGNKPTTNVFGTTSGGFGQPTTSQPTFGGFGQTQPQTNTLFSNPNFSKPATGGFGTVQPQNNVFMGVNLNQPQAQATTNLFGPKTSNSIFGQPQQQQNTMSFSGFGQQLSGLSFGQSMLGQPTQQTSLFPIVHGNTTTNIHDQILTITKPYYSADCLKKLSPVSNNKVITTNPMNLQSAVEENVKFSSKLAQVPLKMRTLSSSSEMKSLFDGLEANDQSIEENLFATKPRNPRRLYIKPNQSNTNGNITIQDSLYADLSTIRNESDITIKSNMSYQSDSNGSSWVEELKRNCDKLNPINCINNNQPQAPLSSKYAQTDESVLTSTKITTEQTPTTIDITQRDDLNTTDPIEPDLRPISTRIVCTRPGYYTIPSLEELAKIMTPDGRCMVQGFTIGRHGYGNVFFPDLFDVSGINIDQHVHFRTKELVIYVDDDNKPPLGQELNRPAQITLDQVYPRDKDTLHPIMDVDRLIQMNFEEILRNTCERHGTRFMDYRPETGSWVFDVEHFTRYGFDIDEENTEQIANQQLFALSHKMMDSNFVFRPNQGRLFTHIIEEDDVEPMDDKESEIEDIPSDDEILEMVGSDSSPIDDESEEASVKDSIHSLPSARMKNMRHAFFDDDNGSIASSQASGRILTTSSYVDLLTDQQIFLNEVLSQPSMELESAEELQEALSSHHFHTPLFINRYAPLATLNDEEVVEYSELVYQDVFCEPQSVDEEDIDIDVGIGYAQLPEFEEIFGTTNNLMDLSINRGINFRTSFGKGDHFFMLNKWNCDFLFLEERLRELNENRAKKDEDFDEASEPQVPELLHLTFYNENYSNTADFKKYIQEHLSIQLAHGDIEPDSNNFPFAFPLQGPKALHQHSETAQQLYRSDLSDMSTDDNFRTKSSSKVTLLSDKDTDSGDTEIFFNYKETLYDHEIRSNPESTSNYILSYTAHLWKLFEALWGEILELECQDADDHLTTSVRRTHLSTWMEQYMEEELRLKESQSDEMQMFDYVIAHKLLEASSFALDSDNLSLAVLVQIGSSRAVRHFLKEQIDAWKVGKYGLFIPTEIQKLYLLLAGIAVNKTEMCGVINVCEKLNWLETYALHLWYLTPLEMTIKDVTNEYINAFEEEKYAVAPKPLYTIHVGDFETNVPIYDLFYHLLRLYSDNTYPLEPLLNPANYTIDPTDYSISWFALENLKALGYVHIRESAEDKIHERFASQLERVGLWEWAIFVLLHIQNSHQRRAMVINIINRNVSIDNNNRRYMNKENFVVCELNIPSHYFSHAKAYKAMSQMDYNSALSHFIAAKDGDMALKVFWDHVGPKEMTNKNYKYIRRIIQYMIMGGYEEDLHLIIYYFIQEIDRIMKKIKNGNLSYIQDYLDRITSQLPTICDKVMTVKTRTPEQVLMISEICKDIVNLVKIVVESLKAKDITPLTTIAMLASKLPIPPDYLVEEIHDVIDLYIERFVSQGIGKYRLE